MIGLVILAQRDIAVGLLEAVDHVLGHRPQALVAFPVSYDTPPDQLGRTLHATIAGLDHGDGVLILADIYGATHINVACRLLEPQHIELVTGVNLPMLIRVLNYRDRPLGEVIQKALSGGMEGIVRATEFCLVDGDKHELR
ncbi:MAG: PTS fructose transporter subunit IIA [Gammaproteobacteria bacterium]|nr:PTS fructose transporter subunit IIA [Gammaproteobacteria bacterium]